MKQIILYLFVVVLLFVFPAKGVGSEILNQVKSPDGRIKIELIKPNTSTLSYRVFYDEKQIVDDSKLGLKLSYSDLSLNLVSESFEFSDKDEKYTLPSGKSKIYTNKYNELTATFRRLGDRISIVFRVFDDGFAFRYELPARAGAADLLFEASEICVSGFEYSWAQPYRMDYSYYYAKRNWDESRQQEKFCAPVLVQSANTWLLLTEAANYGTYSTSMITANEQKGSYSFKSETRESISLPFSSPWRTVMLGDLPTIMKSSMVENLNPPTALTDLSWIIPGRSSWDWGGEDAYDIAHYTTAVKYIDFAHEMGWEYFTLDDGWDRGDYTLRRVINYANSKNVKIILWSHSNRFTNNQSQIRSILKGWKQLGIAGVKVDFWESDTRETMEKYDNFMEVSVEQQLLVNHHGCNKPSGTRRRWPNLLTSEATFGGEMYLFSSDATTAAHNVNLAMTRNVIGPMDYTPCDFGSRKGRVKQFTSWAHQLAMLTVYESGIQCYIDRPENYRYHLAQSFMKRIPAAWDEILPIEAKPDSYVTIARKHGDDWYIGSLCNEARTLHLDLSFLEKGRKYYAYIYKDGDCMSEISFDYISDLTDRDEIKLSMQKSGGATIHLSTSPSFPRPEIQKYEAESEENIYPRMMEDPDGLCSGGRLVSYVGAGNSLVFNNIEVKADGEYAMTVFFMNGEERTAFVKVNDGEPMFHTFNSVGGWEGNGLGFVTILVTLKKGMNTIEFGNDKHYAPNFDRITIKPLVDEQEEGQSLISEKGTNKPVIHTVNNEVIIISPQDGECSVFSLQAKLLKQEKINMGENRVKINDKGVYIINVNTRSFSYSTKQIVK